MGVNVVEYEGGTWKVTGTALVGRVFGTFEENGWDDSDFLTVYWSEEHEAVRWFVHATTRAAGCGFGEVKADATEDVMAAARRYAEREYLELLRDAELYDSRKVTKGKVCRVVKGRKVKVGSTVYVGSISTWNRYGKTDVLATVDVADETGKAVERVYNVNVENLEVADAKTYHCGDELLVEKAAAYAASLTNARDFVSLAMSLRAEKGKGSGLGLSKEDMATVKEVQLAA